MSSDTRNGFYATPAVLDLLAEATVLVGLCATLSLAWTDDAQAASRPELITAMNDASTLFQRQVSAAVASVADQPEAAALIGQVAEGLDRLVLLLHSDPGGVSNVCAAVNTRTCNALRRLQNMIRATMPTQPGRVVRPAARRRR